MTHDIIGFGRSPTDVPILAGNDVSIYCPYSGLSDPTNRTQIYAIDSMGQRVPSSQLPSPKYTIEHLAMENTFVLVIRDYSPDDLYHSFVCYTRNQAGEDTQTVTLIGTTLLTRIVAIVQ